MENSIILKENEKIENLIYEIRGKQVMSDSDLAKLYECKNKAVNRNTNKFPENYYFQLTETEYKNLKFQNETSSSNNYGGIRKMPYVFTEQGVYMLATVLRTKVASDITMRIIDAFVYIRRYLSDVTGSNMLVNHEERILKL